ncbi:MAG: DUF2474 family protein [Betaproteobacteria bacterium]|nr:DUF2474 family protein [Betaproteobacteria bacterium]
MRKKVCVPISPIWRQRVAWLVGLWLAGVAVLGLIALLLRIVMRLAGLSS